MRYFFKYQATGNDFIVFDDRNREFEFSRDRVAHLCDRRFGIGSDGILLVQEDEEVDFNLDFINPDGSRSFCGNGSRCAVSFAQMLGMFQGHCSFRAIDGVHRARIEDRDDVCVQMLTDGRVEKRGEDWLVDTGSPHYLRRVDHLESLDVASEGRIIRNNEEFKEKGVNVNFVQFHSDAQLSMRTYERGVENETLSCGTGVTAAAIVARDLANQTQESISVTTRGGSLSVRFEEDGGLWLKGQALKVFSGELAG